MTLAGPEFLFDVPVRQDVLDVEMRKNAENVADDSEESSVGRTKLLKSKHVSKTCTQEARLPNPLQVTKVVHSLSKFCYERHPYYQYNIIPYS
jgi:hypothetical protein